MLGRNEEKYDFITDKVREKKIVFTRENLFAQK